ncbi:unnamed protein product [Nesidiocoris tenuis]|uniref:SH3 domain-containing protein n=1 Tax=Nesidiocoris tenuis TaxID=355587 RepID=A0A6H5H7H3_9HEMI|nr:unnamed protein product [Nesidiocoris tenuis]
MYEHHAGELQLLVGNYRKKNAELRKEGTRGSTAMLQLYEGLLQEVEADSQAHGEIASVLGRQVSRHTLERTFHRKLEARKLLAHRENLDNVIAKSEDNLSKELEDVYTDLCSTLSEAIAQGAEIISNRVSPSFKMLPIPYSLTSSAIMSLCFRFNVSLTSSSIMSLGFCLIAVDPSGDASVLVRNTPIPTQPHPSHRLRLFTPPHTDEAQYYKEVQKRLDPKLCCALSYLFILSDSILYLHKECVKEQLARVLESGGGAPVVVRNKSGSRCAAIQKHAGPREAGFDPAERRLRGVKHRTEHLDSTDTTAARRPEHHVANSTEEHRIVAVQQSQRNSGGHFDEAVRIENRSNQPGCRQSQGKTKILRPRTLKSHCHPIMLQKELFAVKMEAADGGAGGPDRKMSSASTSSMKNKWLKAFKSLKTPPPNGKETEKDKRNGKDMSLATGDSAHQFQEYTYKKITPCDVCSQVLRGHTRQGLKCRLCKMNVHIDCQERVGKCQTKSRLLRRQKSSSDIESRPNPVEDEAPHSPRRQKLNLRMKSLSLDSPESTEHSQRRRPGANVGGNSAQGSAHGSSHSSSSRLQSPSSPVHSRRLLSARNMRMSSVELPDDNEKSISSASTSPCPSPKPHRLLPTNLYVVLYNFKARHADELDLKAGYKLTVIDTSDPDWWRGKCLGRVGYFPSKYVAKVQPGERALQVTHNLQVADTTLLRDQDLNNNFDLFKRYYPADGQSSSVPTKADLLREIREDRANGNTRVPISSASRPLGVPLTRDADHRCSYHGPICSSARQPSSVSRSNSYSYNQRPNSNSYRSITSLSRPLIIG